MLEIHSVSPGGKTEVYQVPTQGEMIGKCIRALENLLQGYSEEDILEITSRAFLCLNYVDFPDLQAEIISAVMSKKAYWQNDE